MRELKRYAVVARRIETRFSSVTNGAWVCLAIVRRSSAGMSSLTSALQSMAPTRKSNFLGPQEIRYEIEARPFTEMNRVERLLAIAQAADTRDKDFAKIRSALVAMTPKKKRTAKPAATLARPAITLTGAGIILFADGASLKLSDSKRRVLAKLIELGGRAQLHELEAVASAPHKRLRAIADLDARLKEAITFPGRNGVRSGYQTTIQAAP